MLDELVKKLAALGVPGIVLVVAMSISGYSGAAALTWALAHLGPFGMLGGVALLGLIGMISHAFAEFGVEKVIEAVVKEQLKKRSKRDIISEIKRYPITKGLKLKIINSIENIV